MSRPSVALRDLMAFMRQRSREQVIGAVLAVLVTIIIVIVFLVDSKINTAPPPTIIYVENYSNRSDEQIIADQKKDQAEKDAYAKEKQRQFQELENKLGIE